jgi:hypothetical protein
MMSDRVTVRLEPICRAIAEKARRALQRSEDDGEQN